MRRQRQASNPARPNANQESIILSSIAPKFDVRSARRLDNVLGTSSRRAGFLCDVRD